MKIKNKDTLSWRIIRNIILFMCIILILGPLYLVVTNSFKTLEEAGRDFFSLPPAPSLRNFTELFASQNFLVYVKNSFQITAIAILLEMILVPSVSYDIALNFS
jgi:raffinose/stachyose/melibiose transport system permease protein